MMVASTVSAAAAIRRHPWGVYLACLCPPSRPHCCREHRHPSRRYLYLCLYRGFCPCPCPCLDPYLVLCRHFRV